MQASLDSLLEPRNFLVARVSGAGHLTLPGKTIAYFSLWLMVRLRRRIPAMAVHRSIELVRFKAFQRLREHGLDL